MTKWSYTFLRDEITKIGSLVYTNLNAPLSQLSRVLTTECGKLTQMAYNVIGTLLSKVN